jgi:hypothetical protein
MVTDFATDVTGCLFLAGAVMLWGGWMLLPRKVGMFLSSDDFPAISARLQLWLWLYRVHLFGVVVSALALVALAALLGNRPEVRVFVWPGAAVGVAGLIVGAVGSAFYYHFGVWGAFESRRDPDTSGKLIESLFLATHYVTCLVRFGRVFCGLGLSVLAVGLLHGDVFPWWIGYGAAGLGVAAMAITMLMPDSWALYQPVFHLQSLWLAATGVYLLLNGLAAVTTDGLVPPG